MFLPGNKDPLGVGYVGFLCRPDGSAWHSSPGRIYSYAASGPVYGLLDRGDVDAMRLWQCRPRLGPRLRYEEIRSGRCVPSKSPMPRLPDGGQASSSTEAPAVPSSAVACPPSAVACYGGRAPRLWRGKQRKEFYFKKNSAASAGSSDPESYRRGAGVK